MSQTDAIVAAVLEHFEKNPDMVDCLNINFGWMIARDHIRVSRLFIDLCNAQLSQADVWFRIHYIDVYSTGWADVHIRTLNVNEL